MLMHNERLGSIKGDAPGGPGGAVCAPPCNGHRPWYISLLLLEIINLRGNAPDSWQNDARWRRFPPITIA